MIDREVDIATADGGMNTFITHPEEDGPHPVVVFYMDAPGKREELHDMARRLGTAGFYVVLPNLYHRRTRNPLNMGVDDARRIMFEHMNSLSRTTVLMDTAATMEFISQDPAANTSRVGVVGYCMSGPFVFWAAAQYPQQIKALAAIHGVRLCTDEPDSAHRSLDRIQAEIYVACAEQDSYAPPAMIEALSQELKQHPLRSRIEWYPQTQHGFVFPRREAVYHKAAAERLWERLLSLFSRTLS